jgi:hypothetical protein
MRNFKRKVSKLVKLKSKGFKVIHIGNSKLEIPDESACLILHNLVMRVVLYFVLPDTGARGDVVVKALHYKPAGRGFDSQWCHWNFSVT